MPHAIGVIRSLGPIDLKSVARDGMLRWLIVLPIGIALAFRWGVPALGGWLAERHEFTLAPYYPLLASFLALMIPTLLGSVVGFLLLDQRDDRTLTALQVTPLTLQGYLLYRAAVPISVSVVMTMAALSLCGLVSLGVGPVFVASLLAAPVALLYALFVASFAKNKVQGFALMKGVGVLTWPPVFAWFVDSPWQLAFGLDPLYWPLKLVWMLEGREPGAWLCFAAGFGYQSLLVALLMGRFRKAINS